MKVRSFINASFLKYVISGGLAFMAEYASFLLLIQAANTGVFVAASLSFIIGLSISFGLNRLWSFRSHQFTRSSRQQVALYLSLALINLGLTNLVILIVTSFGLEAWMAKILAMGMVVVWNFIIFKLVIFKSSTHNLS